MVLGPSVGGSTVIGVDTGGLVVVEAVVPSQSGHSTLQYSWLKKIFLYFATYRKKRKITSKLGLMAE